MIVGPLNEQGEGSEYQEGRRSDGSSVVLILAVARISHTYLQTYIHRARSLYRYIVMANAALPTFKVDFVGAKQVGKTSLACVRSTLFYHDLSIVIYQSLSIVIYLFQY